MMKMALSWRSAYFKQALADYEMFLLLEKTPRIPLCHRLHYLQMMTEKLAKGFNTSERATAEHPHTHAVFVSFLNHVKIDPKFRKASDFKTTDSFRSYLNGLMPMAEKIQVLAPDLAGACQNPEYPWKTPQGVIVAPIEFSFPELDLNAKDLHLIRLRQFLDICFDIAKRELGDA